MSLKGRRKLENWAHVMRLNIYDQFFYVILGR